MALIIPGKGALAPKQQVLTAAPQVEPTAATISSTHPSITIEAVSSETEQAYSDILVRINELTALSGEALEGEMKTLKKALLDNPNACALMLPQDIGQMVTALRRMTGQALAIAEAKPKGKGSKGQKLLLTAEAMAEAFDEL